MPEVEWRYVFDTEALISLQRTNRVRRIAEIDAPGSGLIVPQKVERELKPPRRKSDRKKWEILRKWLERGKIARFVGNEDQLYLNLVQAGLGDGEAAALAIAKHRGATLVSGDKAAIREAQRLGVKCIKIEQLFEELKPSYLK